MTFDPGHFANMNDLGNRNVKYDSLYHETTHDDLPYIQQLFSKDLIIKVTDQDDGSKRRMVIDADMWVATTNSAATANVNLTQMPGYPELWELRTVTSSIRYKENVQSLPVTSTMISALGKLEPKTFNYKNPESEPGIGFIAEDVHEITELAPFKLVMYDKIGRPDALNTMGFVTLLIAAVKNLQERVEWLERGSQP